MPLDLAAVGRVTGPVLRSWTSTDAILYALGVGAGTSELGYATENTEGVTQQAVPSLAAVLSQHPDLRVKLGDVNPAMTVHAQQALELHRPLMPEGTVELTATVTGIYDKGSGALVVSTSQARDPADKSPVFTATAGIFIRGEGGFGGERGPSESWQRPDRSPDAVVRYQTWESQPLLYRLSGDRNPLHSDPAFAARAGFPRPILHGMATYGMCCRALVEAACDGDPARLAAMSGRFSKPVLPGDPLTIAIWRDGADGQFQVTGARDVVLDHGRFSVTDAPRW
jgi:acyl dehydratase